MAQKPHESNNIKPPIFFTQIAEGKLGWFSWPRVPLGHVTLLGARGGAGKGLVAASLAAAANGGTTAFGNCQAPMPGNVLWVEEEDPADCVLKPRLRAAGAVESKVAWARAAWFRRTRTVERRVWLTDNNIRLIILSPLLQAVGVQNINDSIEVFKHMQGLQEAIEGLPIATLGIVHTNKNADMAAIERILGSVTFSNFARSVLLISTRNKEKRLVHAKCNVGPRADDLILTVRVLGGERSQEARVDWAIPINGNCDEEAAFDRGENHDIGAFEQRGGLTGAWLRHFLEDAGGLEEASTCIEMAKRKGYHEPTLKSVRKKAGVESAKEPGKLDSGWWWRLEGGPAWPWEDGTSPENANNLVNLRKPS